MLSSMQTLFTNHKTTQKNQHYNYVTLHNLAMKSNVSSRTINKRKKNVLPTIWLHLLNHNQPSLLANLFCFPLKEIDRSFNYCDKLKISFDHNMFQLSNEKETFAYSFFSLFHEVYCIKLWTINLSNYKSSFFEAKKILMNLHSRFF
jgi:hypothetical protein